MSRAAAAHGVRHAGPPRLWDGAFPAVGRIPLLDEVTHVVVHRGAARDGFLHGAAIVHHQGAWYTSWGSSPVDENSLLERECGRRGAAGDGARRWGPVEVIGPNRGGREARSHGVFHVQDGELFSLVPRFGRRARPPPPPKGRAPFPAW